MLVCRHASRVRPGGLRTRTPITTFGQKHCRYALTIVPLGPSTSAPHTGGGKVFLPLRRLRFHAELSTIRGYQRVTCGTICGYGQVACGERLFVPTPPRRTTWRFHRKEEEHQHARSVGGAAACFMRRVVVEWTPPLTGVAHVCVCLVFSIRCRAWRRMQWIAESAVDS